MFYANSNPFYYFEEVRPYSVADVVKIWFIYFVFIFRHRKINLLFGAIYIDYKYIVVINIITFVE